MHSTLRFQCPRRSGFTLVELLVASTITVMIAAAALMMLSSTSAARERVDRQREVQQRARASVMAVAAAVRNAYRPADMEDAIIEGQDDWFGELPRDRVRLLSVSRRTIRPDQPESDVREVEFFILDPQVWDADMPAGPAAEGDGQLEPALMRRIDPTRNPPPDGGGVLERVASGVIGLNLTYHDGIQWRDEWTQADGWPVAVKVEAVIAREADGPPGSGVIVSRLINFPYLTSPPAEDAAVTEEVQEQ